MVYSQKTGRLTTDIGSLIGVGYAGFKSGKNNPKMQDIKNIGPLPCGVYEIGKPYNSDSTGPFTIPLTPDKNNKMLGRDDFKIHGDLISDPGNGSQGCIIMSRIVREAIHNCTDKILIVKK
jgi:hypothetical protein